jgi:hypothetical protein
MDVSSILLLAIPILIGSYLIIKNPPEKRWRTFWRNLGAFLLAVPCGGLAYLFTGIAIARAMKVGHFYSVPFGGYAVHDSAILGSWLVWTIVFFCLFLFLIRIVVSRKQSTRSENTGEN